MIVLVIALLTGQNLFAQKKEGQARIDSLLVELPKQKEDTNKVKVLMALSNSSSLNPDRRIEFGKEALELAKKLKWDDGQIKVLSILGINHYDQSHYSEAIGYFTESMKLSEVGGKLNGVAGSLGSIGNVYLALGNYPKAMECYFGSLKMNERIGNDEGIAKSCVIIGNSYSAMGKYSQAIEYYQRSLNINEKLKNRSNVSAISRNIGNIFIKQADYHKALAYFYKSLKINEELNSKPDMAWDYGFLGNAYRELGSTDTALAYHYKAIKIFEGLGNTRRIAEILDDIGTTYLKQKKYDSAVASYTAALKIATNNDNQRLVASIAQKIGGLYLMQSQQSNKANKADLSKSILYFEKAIEIYRSLKHFEYLQKSYLALYNAYKLSGRYLDALDAHEQYLIYKDSVFNKANTEKLTRLEVTAEFEKVQLADSLKNEEAKKQAAAKLQRQRNYTYAGIGGVLLLLGFSFFIVKERRKSDKLLLNILPSAVAKELKQKGESDAKLFDDVTVLFTDFVGFTTVSEKLTPKQLVDELHTCFTAFDGIMAKHKIEKIKTVGDAYLAVSGLPLADDRHAENVVSAAIEIRDFMLARKQALGDIGFNIRIGVHSGNVVAGIVGVKKFAYDIWGDTVNTAARMEQKSEAGKINISQTTYELVKDKYTCTYRGEIEAKNKGMLKMYFVEGAI